MNTAARLASVVVLACMASCGGPSSPDRPPRTYMLGFSAAPPRLDIASVLKTIDMWTPRADAALLALSVPWKSMLADTSAALIVNREQRELVQLYRTRKLAVVVMIDVTDGLNRAAEAPELVAAGRSIREPAIQRLYREYAMAVDSILHPDYLGLAMETNLSRALIPREIYDSVRTTVNATAAALTAAGSSAKLYVSVQVETAWGRLPNTGAYVGIDADLRDFPFIKALGLSSYPFLAGFAEPEDVPIDYYKRLQPPGAMPMLIVEGGWSSASVTGVTSTPERQARYVARQMRIADAAGLVGILPITFTDLDLASFPVPPGSILPLFAYLGLVDANYQPKPALAEWDAAFARPRVR